MKTWLLVIFTMLAVLLAAPLAHASVRSVTTSSAVLAGHVTCQHPCRFQWQWRQLAHRWTHSRPFRRHGYVTLRLHGLKPNTRYQYRLCVKHHGCVGGRFWTRMRLSPGSPPSGPTPTSPTPSSGSQGSSPPARATTAAATPGTIIASSRLGVNTSTFDAQGNLKEVLGMGKANPNGLGVVRFEMIEGTPTQGVLTPAMDTAVAYYANRGLTLYAMLALGGRAVNNFVTDSNTLDTYATAFMKRFGVNGSFWSQNPSVPYHPVTQVEIGNEPNTMPPLVADNSGMHYKSPGAFAYVYAHARAAIKAVNSSARVIVGGLAPLDFSTVKTWLASFLDSSYTTAVDSVGWHPYMMNDNANEPQTVAQIESFTDQLHQVEISHGYPNAKIDLNEFDSSLATTGTYDAWGQDVVQVLYWAMCTSNYVADVQPEWWGGIPNADKNVFLALAHDDGHLTPYGSDYLAWTHALTTTGC